MPMLVHTAAVWELSQQQREFAQDRPGCWARPVSGTRGMAAVYRLAGGRLQRMLVSRDGRLLDVSMFDASAQDHRDAALAQARRFDPELDQLERLWESPPLRGPRNPRRRIWAKLFSR